MLIENLVIYTRTPFEDSEGKMILHGYPVPYHSDHYLAQSSSGYDKQNSGAMRFEYDKPIFNSLELVSAKKRFGGTKNHQVLLPSGLDNHYIQCDIKDETINDVMFLEGIEKGKLKGEFTFIKNGSLVQLTLIGSKEYEKHLEQSKQQEEAVKILNKDLKVGYGYSTPKGEVEVFLGAYYQNDYKMVGGSKLVEPTATKTYFFVVLKGNEKHFITKRTQRFTKESSEQIISVEEANAIFGSYIDEAKSEMQTVLSALENVYMKHYIAHTEDATLKKKEYHVIKAKEEARKLVNRAYELYRQYITNADKSLVVYDKNSIYDLVYSRLNKGIEEVKIYGFI